MASLTKNSRVQELEEELSKLTNIPINQLKVLRGFPPATVDLGNKDNLLCNCGFQERDAILVEQLPTSSVPKESLTPTTQENLLKESRGGILLKQVVPSDNSCLFTSIGFCLSGLVFSHQLDTRKLTELISKAGKIDGNGGGFMRELVASTVLAQPDQYNEALLGKPNKEYCKWIQKVGN